MNADHAFYNGNLANNFRFFGTSTSEVMSVNNTQGVWNIGNALSPNEASPISFAGGVSSGGAAAGALVPGRRTGGVFIDVSHRTILLGY